MKAFIALCLILAASINVSSAFNCADVKVGDATIYYVCGLATQVSTFHYDNNTVYNKYTTDMDLAVSLGDDEVLDCNNSTKNGVYATIRNNTNATNPTCFEIASAEPTIALLDEEDPSSGLTFTFPGGDGNFSLVFELTCDKDVPSKKTFDSSSFSKKAFTVSVTSANSCPNSYLSKLSYFFDKYPLVFTIIFVVIGAFICFFGLTMFNITIFLIGAVGGTILSAYLFLGLLSYNAHSWAYWLVFAVCVIIGLVVGWVAVKIETLGFIVLGAVLGVVGGNLLFVAVVAPMGGSHVVIYYVILVVAGLIGSGLAYKFWKSFVIIATGILGSFLVVKAIGGAIGNFPSADSAANGFEFTPVVYAYLAGIIVLAIAGMYVQHKRKKAAEIEEDADVHGYQRVMAGYNA